MERQESLITIEEAARFLEVTADVVQSLVDAGTLQTVRTRNGRRYVRRDVAAQMRAELQEARRRDRWSEDR